MMRQCPSLKIAAMTWVTISSWPTIWVPSFSLRPAIRLENSLSLAWSSAFNLSSICLGAFHPVPGRIQLIRVAALERSQVHLDTFESSYKFPGRSYQRLIG